MWYGISRRYPRGSPRTGSAGFPPVIPCGSHMVSPRDPVGFRVGVLAGACRHLAGFPQLQMNKISGILASFAFMKHVYVWMNYTNDVMTFNVRVGGLFHGCFSVHHPVSIVHSRSYLTPRWRRYSLLSHAGFLTAHRIRGTRLLINLNFNTWLIIWKCRPMILCGIRRLFVHVSQNKLNDIHSSTSAATFLCCLYY